MDYLSAIILGVVEGATEFLPISSTAHLLISEHFLGLSQTDLLSLFNIIVQCGAILAVLVYAPRRLLVERKTQWAIVWAFIPTAILGLLLKDAVGFLHGYLLVSIAALFLGGVFMLFFESRIARISRGYPIEALSKKSLVAIGALQTIAFIPGISRSAATIYAGLSQGLSKKEAVAFSFFLGIPTMASAGILSLFQYNGDVTWDGLSLILCGTIVSFIVAYSVIHALMAYIEKRGFTFFAWYRIVFSILLAGIFLL